MKPRFTIKRQIISFGLSTLYHKAVKLCFFRIVFICSTAMLCFFLPVLSPAQILNVNSPDSSFTYSASENVRLIGSDGKYLFLKEHLNSGGRVKIFRLGSGYQTTTAGDNDKLIAVTNSCITAVYFSDGYIYNCTGSTHKIEKINTVTGEIILEKIPAGLIELNSSLVKAGPQLIVTDGKYVYNIAYQKKPTLTGINYTKTTADLCNKTFIRQWLDPENQSLIPAQNIAAAQLDYNSRNIFKKQLRQQYLERQVNQYTNGWTIQVFDPNSNWKLIKIIVTPNSSFITAAALTDGSYLYPIEMGQGQIQHRGQVSS